MADRPMMLQIGIDDSRAKQGVAAVKDDLEQVRRKVEDLTDETDRLGKDSSTSLDKITDHSDDATDALDDTQDAAKRVDDAIDDLGDNQAPMALADDLDDAADAADAARREADDLADALDDAGSKGHDASRNIGDGASDAGDKISGLKDAAADAAGEIGESLSGEPVDALDGIGNAVAGVLTSLGGLGGAVAGAGVAAAIGLITGELEENEEAARRAEEATQDWAQAYIDAGGTILSTKDMLQRLEDVLLDPKTRQQAESLAATLGVDLPVAVNALAGSQEDLATVTAGLEQAYEDLDNRTGQFSDTVYDNAAAQQAARGVLDGLSNAVDGVSSAQNNGQAIADAYQRAIEQYASSAQGATQATDELGNTVYELPDGATITIDAATGQASSDLDALEQQMNTIPDGNVFVNAQVNRSALDAFLRTRLVKNITLNPIVPRGERWAF